MKPEQFQKAAKAVGWDVHDYVVMMAKKRIQQLLAYKRGTIGNPQLHKQIKNLWQQQIYSVNKYIRDYVD